MGIDRGCARRDNPARFAEAFQLVPLGGKIVRILAGHDLERCLDQFSGGVVANVENEIRSHRACGCREIKKRTLEAEGNPAAAQVILEIEELAGDLALIDIVNRDEVRSAGQWLCEAAERSIAIARVVLADDDPHQIGWPDQRS